MNVPSAYLPWSRSLAPSEQRLNVGPTEVLFSVEATEFLACFLHSNTTRSLHCLWQFIPQSIDKTPWSESLSLLQGLKTTFIQGPVVTYACTIFWLRASNIPNEPSILTWLVSPGAQGLVALTMRLRSRSSTLVPWREEVVSWLSYTYCLL